ncbi:hypothetical protein EV401DRAFT_1893869 [Pisolithus croceorrhizus]|nr:hypothetical protein EV401DRAFT_1893869 [Pisolithus croceorrhizus]
MVCHYPHEMRGSRHCPDITYEAEVRWSEGSRLTTSSRHYNILVKRSYKFFVGGEFGAQISGKVVGPLPAVSPPVESLTLLSLNLSTYISMNVRGYLRPDYDQCSSCWGKAHRPCNHYPSRCSISLTTASSRLHNGSYESDESRVQSEFCVVPDSVLLACISAIVARHWTAHAARLIACGTLESPIVIAAALHLRNLLLRWCHRHRLSTDHVPCISCISQFASASTNATAIFIISRAPRPDKVCLTPLYFISNPLTLWSPSSYHRLQSPESSFSSILCYDSFSLLHAKPSQAGLGKAALKSFSVLSRIRLPLDTSLRAIKTGNLTAVGRYNLPSYMCYVTELQRKLSGRTCGRVRVSQSAALTVLTPVSAGWLSMQVHNRFRVRVEVLRKEILTSSGTSYEIAPIPNTVYDGDIDPRVAASSVAGATAPLNNPSYLHLPRTLAPLRYGRDRGEPLRAQCTLAQYT